MNKVLFSSIKEANQSINNGNIRPSELCKAAVKLATITKSLNAYITVTDELAKEQAQAADTRQEECSRISTLDGIPIAVKDNYCTEGVLTSCASFMLANYVPCYNSTVYKRLKQSGAVLIGKTNLDEFAMGSGTIDSYYGPTRNLWGSDVLSKYYLCKSTNETIPIKEDPDKSKWHITGGSSGGSAIAVASGTCFAALGSDTGGSVRNPAAYCGLIGLKPTYGLISRYGLIPLQNSMDCPGVLSRCVDDAVAVLNVIAGPDKLDSTTVRRKYTPFNLPDCSGVSSFTIGIPKEYRVDSINEETKTCWDYVISILKDAGAKVVDITLPHTDYSIVCYSVLNRCDVASNLACYDGVEYGFRAEGDTMFEMYKNSRSKGFNNVVKGRILVGNYFLWEENYEQYFVKAMKIRRLIAQDFKKAWEDNIDVILTPTTLTEAPEFNEFSKLDNQTQCIIQDYCTQPANMAGIPSINVPVRLTKKGLPVSVQLTGPSFEEEKLLTIAKFIEKAVNFPKLQLKEPSLLN